MNRLVQIATPKEPHLKVWGLTGGLLSAWLCASPIAAQVVPDTTLPVGERSQVTGNASVQIDGGARRGSNLFHSFSQFSIPTGGSAYFNNAMDVQNIFGRITGGSISNIDGVIRANDTANLFLLNPNGILFGPNARLNIGGSFVATTANSIDFADNFQYSATDPQTAPLLTVSVPLGLQMGTNAGAIVVEGSGSDVSFQSFFSPAVKNSGLTGLQVSSGKTLALIGGDVEVAGGTLTAEQGHIELGSVASGQVKLTPISEGFALSYSSGQPFGNIRLSQQALIDASGGGSIQVQGNNVSLTDGSIVLIQNQGAQQGGNIRVQAASSLKLSGESPTQKFIFSGLHSETTGSGSGASIAVFTPMLIVQEGGGIVTYSFESGRGGNVTISAPNKVQVSGGSPSGLQSSIIATFTLGSGLGGDITLSTRQLTADSGAGIQVAVIGSEVTLGLVASGAGRSGNLVVDADSIDIIGASPISLSALVASTFGTGDAGDVILNTRRLTVRDGGIVFVSTFSGGKGGSLTINALESVDVTGRALLPVPGSSPVRTVSIPSQISSSGFLSPPELGRTLTGAAGNVTLTTERLSVTDGANIDVSNQGAGDAGTLRLVANSVVLDRQGSITAATAFGQGGNINLNVRDFVLLRNNSPITASADGTGNGGNIRINARAIVAVPAENSDIRANSVNARGGNVTINTSGIFGIQSRPQDTPLSDITATGASSAQSGTVQLNIEQLDPTSGLVELPTTVADPSRLIAQGCPADRGNSFVITGRGGLPPTPEQQLDDNTGWQDRRRLTAAQQTNHGKGDRNQKSEGQTNTLHLTPPTPIIEASGWEMTPTGEVLLVASSSNPVVQNSLHQPATCNGRR